MFGFHFFPEEALPFNKLYHCYSMAMLPGNEREDVDRGGKIILPPSALDHLTRLSISFPMLFKLSNQQVDRSTHAGVLEFVAEEGKVFLPYWMMKYLLLEEGELINVENVSLPVGTYSKFQPQSKDFLDISNPKAVLESCFRHFACLSTGDMIAIPYNDRVYELCVLETKPGPAVSIIECDMSVDFAPPVGYTEPVTQSKENEEPMMDHADLMEKSGVFFAFKGKGNRLDGKKRDSDQESPPWKRPYQRGIPDYDYNFGEINFIRNSNPYPQVNKENEPREGFKAFSGEGYVLKKKKE